MFNIHIFVKFKDSESCTIRIYKAMSSQTWTAHITRAMSDPPDRLTS